MIDGFINGKRLLTSSDTFSGGVNLFRNTDKLDKFWVPFTYNQGQADSSANYASDVNHELIATKSVFHAWGSKANETGLKCTQQIYFEPGVYTISFLAKNNGTDFPSFNLGLYSDYTDSRSGRPVGTTHANLTNVWQQYSITFRIDQAGTYGSWRLINWSDAIVPGGALYFANLKLERGPVATDWCPNYADYYDDLSNQIIGMRGLFHIERVDKTIKAKTIQYPIAAPAVEGYQFVFWLSSATVNLIGSTYIDTPNSKNTNIWIAYPDKDSDYFNSSVNGSTSVSAFAVYVNNSIAQQKGQIISKEAHNAQS